MDKDSLEEAASSIPSTDSLCRACKTISGEALLRTSPFEHGKLFQQYNEKGELEVERNTPSIPGLYHTLFLENPAATVKTCAACRLFHKATDSGITLSEPAVLRLCLAKKRDVLEVQDVAKVERERGRAEKSGETANLVGTGSVSVFADYGTVAAKELPRRTIGLSGSEKSIACIQRWLHECDSNHPTCRLGLVGDLIEAEPQMPTRVIDVVSFDGKKSPRLLETNGLRARYIAVSHSWGTVVKPYTTMKNIESLKERIDLENLPKTFYDSIYIARKLEVQYVWIDSICIIQDNHEDWEREAKIMGLVYEKAYLAISASESSGDHAGFLTPNPDVQMEVKLPYQSRSPAFDYLYLRNRYTGVIAPQRSTISHRGWVLQERTLSRRILHFDGTQAHWECSRYRVSEDGDKEDTISNVNTSYYLGQHIRPIAKQKFSSDISDHTERHEALGILYHFYACKIHEFSDCKLTLASDKLPAILGLGNEISRGTGIRCLEGHLMFEEPLFVYSLLWHTEIFGIRGSAIPKQVRAPSWSWAAMEGTRVFHILGQDIKFERRIYLRINRVLEVDALNLKPYNALECCGRILAGTKGDPMPGRYGKGLMGMGSRSFHEQDERFKPPDFAYQLLEPFELSERRWPRKSDIKGWVCYDSMEIRPENFLFVPVCAPLAGQEDDHPETTRGCLGLVVVDAPISKQDMALGISSTYKRVGFGGVYGTSWVDKKEEVDFLLL